MKTKAFDCVNMKREAAEKIYQQIKSMTLEEKFILFGGFAVSVVAIFLYIARDLIFRRKTQYDKEEFESKKDRTYEKYHSDWTDDYVDFTYTRPSKDDEEFRKQKRES